MDIQDRPADASAVLQRLSDAISGVVEGTETGWRLASMADLGDGPVLVDAEGKVLEVLTETGIETPDEESAVVLEALVAAYDCVLAAERRAVDATVRAERAERDAYVDHLTGLPNRRAWDQALAREQARCDRSDGNVAVAVVDLDDLKQVNDERGHLAGDLLLRHSARALQEAFRTSDLVSRTGGDEFAVLAVDFHDGDGDALADRIAEALEAAGVAASSGASTHRRGERLADVWQRADQAMYVHKRSRKG